jgi:hypothetical protein
MSADLASSASFYAEINNDCERFEAAWRSGGQPQIDLTLPRSPRGRGPN